MPTTSPSAMKPLSRLKKAALVRLFLATCSWIDVAYMPCGSSAASIARAIARSSEPLAHESRPALAVNR